MSQVYCKAWGRRSRFSYLSHKTGTMKNVRGGDWGRVILLWFQMDAMVKIWLTAKMRAVFLVKDLLISRIGKVTAS